MIQIEKFFEPLLELGYNYYSGVPCSYFKPAINYAIASDKTEFYMAPNEGLAVSMGAGAYMAGGKPVILMQNSGLTNASSPLISLNELYDIPAMVLVSGRAFEVDDEPQHEVMANRMFDFMDSMGIKWKIIPETAEEWAKGLKEADEYIMKEKKVFAWVARKGALSDFAPPDNQNDYPMTRYDAVTTMANYIDSNYSSSPIFGTTGMISRELYDTKDRPENFYMMGSMGHIAAFAMGFAHKRKDLKTFVFDGDGSLLMHSGILSSIGHEGPKNLYHILIDNHVHQSTGGQSTTASTTDFVAWAKAAGYKYAAEVKSMEELEKVFPEFTKQEAPAFLRVYVSSKPKKNPRITEKYSSSVHSENFQKAFRK